MGGRRNKSGKVWRAKVARVAKRVTLQNQETKCYPWVGVNSAAGGTFGIIPLYSNAGSTSGVAAPYIDLPLDNIDTGVTKGTRVGNDITLKGMTMHLQFQQDENNTFPTKIRVMMCWVDPNFSTSSILTSTLLENAAVAGNDVITALIRGPNRPDSIIRKVVMDRVYSVNTMNAPYLPTAPATNVNRIGTHNAKLNVRFHNKKYQFINVAAGSNGEKEDLMMFVWGWAPGQANTVQVANMKVAARVYYKDG